MTAHIEGIEGVEVAPLLQIPDSRGTVRRFITSDELEKFGDCYTTTVYKGIIKGLHGYITKTMYYCVPVGLVKLVLWDIREGSPTHNMVMQLYVGVENFVRVKIPPRVMNAFQGIADTSLAVVVATEPFSEERTIRMPWNDSNFPYDWSRQQ